jgi:anti-anti-sigma regulatory factor
MDIDLKVSDNRALLSVRGSLNSDNAPQLQEKLNEVLIRYRLL